MKKMMTIAALAISASLAHGASVNWQVTSGTADQVGYNVYLVSAIDAEWTGASDIATAAAALGTGTSGTIAKNGRVYNIPATVANGDGITTTSMANAYLVLVTDTTADSYKYISVDMSANVFGETDSAKETFGTTTAALLAGTTGSYATTPGPTPDPGDVPEPTTGMLVLLGVAGLALRRRA